MLTFLRSTSPVLVMISGMSVTTTSMMERYNESLNKLHWYITDYDNVQKRNKIENKDQV